MSALFNTAWNNGQAVLTEQSARRNQQDEQAIAQADKWLKYGVWAYFLLIIFEGALRKWALPALATPLLVVRDPIAVWLMFKVWQRNIFPTYTYLTGVLIIGIISIFTALTLGHGSLPVAIYGARILLIHFPMMFMIGVIFTREDVVQVGRVCLWLAVPMTVLVTLQFYSPQSAWVNRGIGGDIAGAGFSGAMDYFRPPGTFSFTTGNTQFYSFLACYIFYFWLNPKEVNRLLLMAATAAFLVAIPISISRSLFFQTGVAMLFALFAMVRRPQYFSKLAPLAIGSILGLLLLSKISFFQTAMLAFTDRFVNANESEGGVEGVLLDRYLGGLVGAFTTDVPLPFFGYGAGMGTNVGSMILTGGQTFLISEGEWGRLIGELGTLLGTAVIIFRLGFCLDLALGAYRKISTDILPWMLLSFALLIIPQGQWAQPTTLGFSTLLGGLMLASFKDEEKSSAQL